jgi:hypothetical protein
MTFKLTQEQTETIQAVFDKQSPGKSDYECWEGIYKQIQKQTEEGKEDIIIFYQENITPNEKFFIHKVKVHRD